MVKMFKGYLMNNKQGFTVIELVIVIALVGILGTAVVMSISQVFQGSLFSNNFNTAMNNVRTAGDWISLDGRMAKTVVPSSYTATQSDATSSLFTFTWIDNVGITHTTVYTYSPVDKTITRAYTKGAEPTVTTGIAHNVSVVTYSVTDNVITLTVEAKAGSGSQEKTATNTYEIALRNKQGL